MYPPIIELEGADVERLAAALAGARAVRVTVTERGFQYSVDQGMWTVPLGKS